MQDYLKGVQLRSIHKRGGGPALGLMIKSLYRGPGGGGADPRIRACCYTVLCHRRTLNPVSIYKVEMHL